MLNENIKKLSIIVVAMLLLITSVILVPNIKAIDDGETTSFRSVCNGTGSQSYKSGRKFTASGGYIGTCRQAGVEASNSGSAKFDRVSNSSNIAKAAYWFGIKKNFEDELGDSDEWNKGFLLECIMQEVATGTNLIEVGGFTWVPSSWNSDNDPHGAIENYLDDHDGWKTVVVPSGFEIFKGNPTDGSQDFFVWKYTPEPPTFAKAYNSGSIGAGGAKVRVGQEITYKITWDHNEGTATIKDTLGAGLEFSSVPSGCSTSGQVMTCTSTQESGTIVYKAKVKLSAAGTTVCNSAVGKSGDVTQNLTKLCNPVPEFKATKAYASGSKGTGGAAVKKGDELTYQISWTEGNGNVVVKDTLSTGLEFVSASPSPTSRSGQTITWSGLTGTTGTITYKVKVTDAAAGNKVCNSATATAGLESKTLARLCNYVPTKNYATDTPKGNDHEEVRKGDVIKYSIKYGNTTSGEEAIRIVDTLSAGLEYVNGSASMTPTSVTKDEGTGETVLVWVTTLASQREVEITYSAKINGALTLVNNDANIKYNDRPVIDLNILKNPVPTKVYSPSSPSGLNGYLVKKGDIIKYRIKYANAYDTTENVVIIDTISKGLEYVTGSAKVKDTYLIPRVEENQDGTTTMTWRKDVLPGVVEELEYDVRVTGETVRVKNEANIRYKNRPNYYLNELHNPVPGKKYSENTPAGLDGLTVKKNDIIEYKIEYSNVFNENKEATIVDTLSKGLEYQEGTSTLNNNPIVPTVKKNKDGTTTLTWKKTVEANAIEKIVYKVKATGETIKVNNSAYMRYDNGVDISIGELHNPLPKKEYASDTEKGKDGEVVKKGDIIKYSIKYANTYDTDESVLITDVLSDGLEYVEGSAQLNGKRFEPIARKGENGTTMLVWIKTLEPGEEKEITYKAQVTGKEVVVENQASIKYGGRRESYLDVLKNPVPKKEYSEYTPSGKDGSAVEERSKIKYSIKYANAHDKKHIEIITDTISKGLEYVKGSAKIGKEQVEPAINKHQDGTTTLTWKREVEANTKEELTYDVLVTGETTKVKNEAKITYDHNVEIKLEELKNPVPHKKYAKDTRAGAKGRIVKKNDIIKYSIKYSNVKKENSKVKIMDQISKGLEYVKGSAKINGKKLDPVSVTVNSNGTMLVWMKEIAKETDEELTYEVKVTGTRKIVENKATIKYDDDPTIRLEELRNPLLVEEQEVKVPNTASNIAIAAVATGTVFMVAGGYLIYKRYKNV